MFTLQNAFQKTLVISIRGREQGRGSRVGERSRCDAGLVTVLTDTMELEPQVPTRVICNGSASQPLPLISHRDKASRESCDGAAL